MMPALKALFDLPRRLLPGKGARMQGYGDKRTIVGVNATGVNGVYTLSQSDRTRLTPSLGTDEEPVELRAGQGVRLHGYGGIYTLERLLPLPTLEESPLQIASLELEVETFEGYSRICYLAEASQPEGAFVISEDTTQIWTLGSYIDTASKSGAITGWGPEDTPPAACEDTEYSSTYDPDYNPPDGYGSFVSSSTSQTTEPHTSILTPAQDAMGLLSNTVTPFAPWARDAWQNISEEVTPFVSYMPFSESSDPQFGTQTVRRVRYRMRNTGNVNLRINHGFYGSGISGGAADELFDTTLAGSAQTGWFDSSLPNADPDQWRRARINRVRIGPYLSVP